MELNQMELNQMELAYKLDEVIGWKESDYEKEDYELDLTYNEEESESCERSM